MYCKYCGNIIDEDSVFCKHCGRKFSGGAPLSGAEKGHEWVDLGLSVKWATCNVGATSPSDYGGYYAWGDIYQKRCYERANYYVTGIDIISGCPKYDVARANWGGTWRIPTKDEQQELIDKCIWTWTAREGHNGYKVTGANGNSIFLPATGVAAACYIKTRPAYEGVDYFIVNGVWFNSEPGKSGGYWSASKKKFHPAAIYYAGDKFNVVERAGFQGMTIRPVTDLQDHQSSSKPTGVIAGHEYVDLGLSVKWATCNVGASSPLNSGDLYAWAETTTKSSYTKSNSTYCGRVMDDIAGNPRYDVARAKWGGTWRLPTKDEINELISKCSWEWVNLDGKNSFKVTGSNGNSIFLLEYKKTSRSLLGEPKDIVMYDYMTSTPDETDLDRNYILSLNFRKWNDKAEPERVHGLRYCESFVRPVSD